MGCQRHLSLFIGKRGITWATNKITENLLIGRLICLIKKVVRLMNDISIQSGLLVLGVLLIVIVTAMVITFEVYHSNFYIVLAMLISLTVLIAGVLMITRHPEWLVAPKTEDQGMLAWTFVLFMAFAVLWIGAAFFTMIETRKK